MLLLIFQSEHGPREYPLGYVFVWIGVFTSIESMGRFSHGGTLAGRTAWLEMGEAIGEPA